MERNQKVVIIFTRFGPHHVARITAAYRRLSAQGHSVTGLEVASRDSSYHWKPQGEDGGGFHRRTLFGNASYNDLSRWRIMRRIWHILREEKPSVVVMPGWYRAESHAALLWCTVRQRPAITMSDSKVDDMSRFRWRETMKGWLVRRFRAALVAGSPQIDYAVALGIPRERCFVGYDVVDNDYFARQAELARSRRASLPAGVSLPEKYFLTVARFIPEKNLPRAVEAYALYQKRIGATSWKWLICGDGPLRNDLERKVAEAGLQDWIVFLGFKQYEEIPLYYGMASAFWLPSQKDTWGLAVNEAMASGLPVLVSKRCGCARDLLRDGENGWVFEPRNVLDMAGCLVRMHEMADDRRAAMGQASRRIIADWGLERFAEGLEEAISAAVGNGTLASAAAKVTGA